MGDALAMLHCKFQPLDAFQPEDRGTFACVKTLPKPLKVAMHLYGFSIAIYGEN